MNKKEPRLGPELFYTDHTGRKIDADLHSEMLDGISPEDDAALHAETIKRVSKYMSPEAIRMLYGKKD